MLATLLRLICKLLFRVRLHGRALPPANGRLLIIANHESFLDGLLLGLHLPFRPTFVIYTGVLDNWLFRQFLKLVPHLTVDHASPLGIKKIIRLIEAGEPVVIFPEGRITNTGSLMKVYEGPAFVAAKTGATIMPVRIHGAAHSHFGRLSRDFPRKLLPRIDLWFMPTSHIAMPDAPLSKQRRKLAGEAMCRLMQEMLAASQPERTLFGALLDAVQLHGRKTLLMEDMKQTRDSYGSLLKKSLALGRLVSKVSRPEEAVGVLMPNVNTTVALIFGMTAMRRTPAMLNYTAGAQGMRNACVAAAVSTIITSRQFIEAARLEDVVAALQDFHILYLEDMRSSFGLKDKLWLMLFALRLPRLAEQSHEPDKPAAILFTSGSEGKPKGVVLSHSAILANVAQIRAVIDFSPKDKFFIALPLFHSFGFTAGAVLPVVSGTRLFIYPSPLHYRLIPEIVYDSGCTVLFGTSAFLAHYGKFAHPYDFHKLRHVVAGAEKLNEEVRRLWMDKFGIRLLEGYGTTECAPVLAVNTPMFCRSGSVGRLLPLLQHRLQPVPGIERGGLLHIKGPNVMHGYYLYEQPGQLAATTSDFGSGWYNTGDIVDIDANGYVHILGRVNRFAKVAGEMVSLEIVEQLARHASGEQQHAASTQTDMQRGENILLFTTDRKLQRHDLQLAAHALGQPEIAIARKIVVVDELPLLGSGKVDYIRLKQMAESVE
ncbi:MAG: bifunctional acyl-ACP--phospholipid O-acyltransferase/long-chain-fatty-acid--ACP ligase [Betaproteobacteria bacterium HGW-Betaproteobacteria-2]|nr:MAG: bifunctional acyl-ACP--phospholipid O-acyltransferase/long-chain-fatty-acid--ACP ligase [Betaproteobacteria bacterium HGW-Betaproteobacteria-2]